MCVCVSRWLRSIGCSCLHAPRISRRHKHKQNVKCALCPNCLLTCKLCWNKFAFSRQAKKLGQIVLCRLFKFKNAWSAVLGHFLEFFYTFFPSMFSSVSEMSVIQMLVLLHYDSFLCSFPFLWYFVPISEIFLQLSFPFIYSNEFLPVLLYQFFNFQEPFLEFLFHLFLNVVLLFPVTIIVWSV